MQELKTIAQKIIDVDGQPFLVGGAVRDMVIGKSPKDLDVEVFNLDCDSLVSVLAQFGKVDLVGKSFGIIKLTTEQNDFDFSLPRRENKQGQGHTGFIVKIDPTMTPREAAMRRDFTFNALSLDLETNQIVDFFGGQDDLQKGIIKATSEHFAEDPLRVLRGMQFAGRFELSTVDNNTRQMCIALRKEFDTLSKERIWIEFEKWATKSAKPSLGLEFLKETSWILQFPELAKLIGLLQDSEWHPEGNCFEHIKQSVDVSVEIAERENLTKEERTILVFAALCHDFGKITTTERCDDGHIRSLGHDKEGEQFTRSFLESLDAPKWLIENVVSLVKEHMFHIHTRIPSARSIRRLSVRVEPSNIKMLCLLMEIDASARAPLPKGKPGHVDRILELAEQEQCKERQVKEILMGRHLIELGLTPGVHFGEILRQAKEAQLNGEFSDLKTGLIWLKDAVL